MHPRPANIAEALNYFGMSESAQVVDLANAGGFSGANLWRVTTTTQEFCLRRWPAEFRDADRLKSLHAVIRHAARRLDYLPVPLATLQGESFVTQGDHFWELTPWLPGRADYHQAPSETKLRAALQAIAKWHLAVADYLEHPVPAPSPGLQQRLEQIDRLQAGEFTTLQRALAAHSWRELRERGERLLALFAASAAAVRLQLTVAVRTNTTLLPCLRDVWHDHVLFTGDKVTGLVDFGALRVESASGDIARLLGSLVRDDYAGWETGLAAYQEVRPLAAAERELIPVFDRSGVLLAGLQWLRWIVLEGRTFPNHQAILQRLDETLQRLERLTSPPRLLLPSEPNVGGLRT